MLSLINEKNDRRESESVMVDAKTIEGIESVQSELGPTSESLQKQQQEISESDDSIKEQNDNDDSEG